MANVYVSSVAYAAVAQWAAATAYSSASNGGRGDYVRQLAAPSANNERVFRCTTSGTSGGAEPSWTLTKNATTNDNTAVWTECTGQEADQVAGTLKAPHATVRNSLQATWFAAGDTSYFTDNHVESVGSPGITWSITGTFASPSKVISIKAAVANIPPANGDYASSGATFTVSSTGISVDTSNAGAAYVAGGSFRATAGAIVVASQRAQMRYRDCKFEPASSNAIAISAGPGRCIWENVICKFPNTGALIQIGNSGGFLDWRGGSIDSAGSAPTTLIAMSGTGFNEVRLEDVDLSFLGSGKTLFDGGAINYGMRAFLKNCKLNASVTVCGTIANPVQTVTVVRGDTGGTNYVEQHYDYYGSQIDETTIVRTGGATDGTTPKSRKIVTSANAEWWSPLDVLPIAVWNDVIGVPITATLFGIWGGAAVPNNNDIWFEAEYLGSSTSPVGTIATSGLADPLATVAGLTADALSTWGGSVGSNTKFKMTATFTPQMKGPIVFRLRAALASSTFYIDPLVVLS